MGSQHGGELLDSLGAGRVGLDELRVLLVLQEGVPRNAHMECVPREETRLREEQLVAEVHVVKRAAEAGLSVAEQLRD